MDTISKNDIEMESLSRDTVNRKNELIRMLLTNISTEKKVESKAKTFLRQKNFLGDYAYMANDILMRNEDNSELPSLRYMQEKHLLLPLHNDMSQYDISELLKEVFIKEELLNKFLIEVGDIKNGNMNKFKNFIDFCNNTLSDLEHVQMCSFADQERIGNVLNKIKDRSDIVYFSNLEGFNRLEIRIQQLVGILGASGGGKSLVMQKLHAMSKDDIVLHFSLELPESLFLRRIFVALGWVEDCKIEYLTNGQIEFLKRRMAKEFPYWFYTCLDTDSSRMNIPKIESMVKYYKNKFAHTNKRIKVFIDYVQLLEENFDPLQCRVNKHLHDVAVRHKVCVIEGIQGNDEASKYDSPPELSMIAFCKSLKNDLDIVQACKAFALAENPSNSIIMFQTKKHRMGKPATFSYEVDHDFKGEENWKLAGKISGKKNPKIDYEKGKHEDYKDEEEEV